MGVLLLVLSILAAIQCQGLLWPNRFRAINPSKGIINGASLRAGRLLPPVPEGTIGSFLDVKHKDQSIIQCNILALSDIGGTEYGVGYPVDMPVMLTYFEGSELKPVRPDYPDYDHLVNHVAVQLEGNDIHLFQTPIVLTLQGEFEDEEFNEVSPFQRRGFTGSVDKDSEERDEEETEEEMEYDESAQEITLEELLRTEDFDAYDDEEDRDGDSWDVQDRDDGMDGWADENSTDTAADAREDSEEIQDELHSADSAGDPLLVFLNSPTSRTRSPGAVASTQATPTPDHSAPATPTLSASTNHADFKLHRPEQPDLSDITPEALVTAEDTAGLQRAHRRADRIIEYATDMRLMGSFHYKKRNFHLVRMLEPIFVMGRRLADIKGHFFALLDERDTEQVRPVLEDLLLRNQQDSSASYYDGAGASARGSDVDEGSVRTARRHSERSSVGRDGSHKGFGDNRPGGSVDGQSQRTNARTTADSAVETRDIGRGRAAGGMAGKVASFAHPAAGKKKDFAGESQYQSAKRKWQQVRKQQP